MRIAIVVVVVFACESNSRVGVQLDAAPDGADAGALDGPASACAPTGTLQAVWVDPLAGSDDDMHGTAPGMCAYRTVTYALAHDRSTSRIRLAAGTYSALESFPLVLMGAQVVECDPNRTGTRAKLMASGASSAVRLAGTANQLSSCEITNPGGSGSCVAISTSGGHVVDDCDLHDCGSSMSGCGTGIDFAGSSGATLTNDTVHDVCNGLLVLGDNVTLRNCAVQAGNDDIFVCGNNLGGCGNSISHRCASCVGCTDSLFAPCP
jgi:hypothetical protein